MRFLMLSFIALLAACSNPHDTPLPKDLAGMESIKPVLDKLNSEEKEMLGGYVVRQTIGASLGAAFGVKTGPIPADMTIGKAIADQREFIRKQRAEEEQQKIAREKAEAERKTLAEQIKQIIGARLAAVSLHKATFRDGDVHSRINFTFEFENKGLKDITGIKGIATFRDRFGDAISMVPFKMEQSVPVGQTVKVRLAKDYNQFSDTDRKLSSLDAQTVTFELSPEVVLFKDGSRFDVPAVAKN